MERLFPFSARYKRQKRFYLSALVLFLAALLLRLPGFNHPCLFIDEDWYLYVGGQMLQGRLPYTDIWDRKPFGLFLLYSLFHLSERYKFIAYQLGGLFFAWASALFLFKSASLFSTAKTALLCALLYLALLNCFSGFGGQSGVFFNFFIIWSFYLVLSRFEEIQINPKSLFITGLEAMFLLGIAVEIKPTAVFSGLYLGAFLLLLTFLTQKNFSSLFLNLFFWIMAALSPTLAVMGFYGAIGHFQDWYFANILSIFCRIPSYPASGLVRLLGVGGLFLTVFGGIFALNFNYFLRKERHYFYFIAGWTSLSYFSLFLIPPFYSWYFLSFALPFSLFCSFLLLYGKSGRLFFTLCLLAAFGCGEYALFEKRNLYSKEEYQALKEIIRTTPNACLFEYGATVSFLELTPRMAQHCYFSRYIFPSHLGDPYETGALGAKDELAELRAILNQQPEFILIGAKDALVAEGSPLFQKKHALIHQRLQTDYHLRYRSQNRNKYHFFDLYQRNDPKAPPSS